MRLSVSAPFSVPITMTLRPRNRPRPPMIAASSEKLRSPASGVNSVINPAMKSRQCALHMGVDLLRRDIGMAEHLLHAAQIGAVVEQVACEGVAQHMRR